MYLIIGANGYLGSYILKTVLEKTTDSIVATARNVDVAVENDRVKWVACDVTDGFQVNSLFDSISNKKELKVIYLAAYHNPDLVEKNPRTAWNINITALSYFVNKSANIKCFFYPSTDSVYGESKNYYHFKESDSLNPVNIYGKQKVLAEQIIHTYGYNVVRYPFLISPSLSPVKKHFYDFILDDLKQGKKVEMFMDSFRSTISFSQAAQMLIQLMENYSESMPKTINICGDSDMSKYDVGLYIARKTGFSDERIVPISIQSGNDIFKAKRASSTLMDNSLIKEILKVKKINLEI